MDTTANPTPRLPDLLPASFPPQAPPVCRDRSRQPQQRLDHGVEASRSGCADLWGPARQMCYAQRSQAL
ncbi:hypothetical protein ACF09C_29005 [Streptomyces sp. NPDC014870]|uniref:hypothetical protein n=1 Tax=Streptomyces sp. NPDC014870 TaxID=3364925 RepID=UPI0036FFBF3D